ncbi:MAG: beta-mannosidase [Chitinophagaceae bacterium]|nr:beta-mannosidase [Chitinophagaceae bacterium]
MKKLTILIRRLQFTLFLSLLLAVSTIRGQDPAIVRPYYITPREGKQHMDLGKDWQLGYTDASIQSPANLDTLSNWINVEEPSTVQIALHKAGKLPHPYYNLNAALYKWVDKKTWYYRKKIDLKNLALEDPFVFLCFDGLDYFSKVWLNGQVLGIHEGMFGGPDAEISKLLRKDQPNEIVVELRAANFNQWDTFDYRKPGRIIKSIDQAGGEGSKPFFALGMWRKPRLEMVPAIHLERPFLHTVEASDTKALLSFETEIYVRKHSFDYELHPWTNQLLSRGTMPSTIIPVAGKYQVKVSLTNGSQVLTKTIDLQLVEGRNWIKEQIVVDKPKLWKPVGMGAPHRYKVSISLVNNNNTIDGISFHHGIRTVKTVPTKGIRTMERWDNFQFFVNNTPLFIKGVNWMPADALLDLPPEKYKWLLGMAKNEGVQLIRVWGGGLLETDDFYNTCDSLGIMVWQDFQVWHQDTPERPQDIWEEQVVRNIFRIRNHPSLVVYCGGNGFNPYSFGSASTMGIVERSLKRFDPTRTFIPTTSDAGNIHTYPDMDPARFAHITKYSPFIAESGMHSITEAASLKEIIDSNELRDLGSIYDKDYPANHPQVISHFVEYLPYRVPRMVSRASHINNMRSPSIETMSEASQVGAGEFFQLMSEGAQSNYPATAGILPWVYNRPWPIFSAIMLVDGLAQPTASYYFLKRTYAPVSITVKLPFLMWAPGEKINIQTALLHNALSKPVNGKVSVSIYSSNFKKVWYKESGAVTVTGGTGVQLASLGAFTIPEAFRDQFFFIVAELRSPQGGLISRASYWPRCLTLLEQDSVKDILRKEPSNYDQLQAAWIALPKGPWLQPAVEKTPTALTMKVTGTTQLGTDRSRVKLRVSNTGLVPSFMTQIDITGAKRSFYATDNFTWMAAGETREFDIEVLWRGDSRNAALEVRSWNAPAVEEKLFK